MNAAKLDRANEIQARIGLLGRWLEQYERWVFPIVFDGTTLLSADAGSRIRAIAKADIEVQLSQLKQEFECL